MLSRTAIRSSIARENVVAGAAGVAALGAVAGMAITSGVGIAAPLLGMLIGAAIGGVFGYIVNVIVQKRHDPGRRASTSA